MLPLGVGRPGPLDVLCLGAHPDDIEIGCGATLLTLAERPATTLAGVVLTATADRAAEAHGALPRFFPGAEVETHDLPDGRLPDHWGAVKELLHDVARRRDPDVVLAPRPDDAHQDHRLLGRLVPTVWRDALVLHYEIPKWDGDLRPMNCFVPVGEATARRKAALLHESFPSQVDRDWWDDELFLGLMRVRGVESKARYAEAFRCEKTVLDLSGGGV